MMIGINEDLKCVSNAMTMMMIIISKDDDDLKCVTSIETAGSQSKHKAPQFGLLAQIVMMMMMMMMMMIAMMMIVMVMMVCEQGFVL